ncbi:hypothetical protein RJT34_16025 [Clitoria ternatea]|uniref:F-box domain-containing protein n=1 Tax=Clitoria ternatea TaxID=43366 RepID=A0AAN9PDB3_CLITE
MSLPRNPPTLPQQLIIEILSWVPVKDLMRFRCVSKSWKSLIFDPTLVKLHLERSSKNTHIILTLEDVSYRFEDYEDLNHCAIPYSVNHLFEKPTSTIDEDGVYRLKSKNVVESCNGLEMKWSSNQYPVIYLPLEAEPSMVVFYNFMFRPDTVRIEFNILDVQEVSKEMNALFNFAN